MISSFTSALRIPACLHGLLFDSWRLFTEQQRSLFFFTCQMLRPPCCVFQPPIVCSITLITLDTPVPPSRIHICLVCTTSDFCLTLLISWLTTHRFSPPLWNLRLVEVSTCTCVSEMYLLNLHACLLNRLIISPSTGRLGSNWIASSPSGSHCMCCGNQHELAPRLPLIVMQSSSFFFLLFHNPHGLSRTISTGPSGDLI